MNRIKNIGKCRFKLGSQQLVDYLINEQLKKYNTTIDSLEIDKTNGKFGEKEWFQYYTFETEREYVNWRNFCLKTLVDNTYPRLNKKKAIRQFNLLDLGFGLNRNYLEINENDKESIVKQESEISGSSGEQNNASINKSIGNTNESESL